MSQVLISAQLTDITVQCREAPSLVLEGAYRRAARRFCGKTRWLQKAAKVNTAPLGVVYTIESPDPDLEVIGIQAARFKRSDGTDPYKVLTEGFSGAWDPNPGETRGDASHTYQYVPEGQVALFPTPDEVWPVDLTVVVQPTSTATTIDSTLLVAWDYALQAGALSFLLNLPRTPWTDKNEAYRQEAIFIGLMNQAHQSAMRGYNAGAAATDRPGSNTGALRTRMLPI